MNTRLLIVAAMLMNGAALAADPAPVATQATAAPAPLITQPQLLARLEQNDIVVVDVRSPAEFAAGHVPGARNIPHDQLAARIAELADVRDKDVALYCRSGRRTLLAEETLRGAGFTKLLHLQGDYLAWEAEQRPVEKLPAPESAPAR